MLKSLARILPTLSGDVTIACHLSDYTHTFDSQYNNVYNSQIKRVRLLPLSTDIYNRYTECNLIGSSYDFDITNFYKYYKDTFFESNFIYNKNSHILVDKTVQQYDRNINYEWGAKRINYNVNMFQYMFFAPIYIENTNDLPSKFVITVKLKKDNTEFVKYININLQDDNKLFYGYLKKYTDKIKNFVVNPIAGEQSMIYFGIDLIAGGIKSIKDISVKRLFNKQNTIQNFDAVVNNGFKRNNIAIQQVLPLSFYFNINDILTLNEQEDFNLCDLIISGYYEDKYGKKNELYDFDHNYIDYITYTKVIKDDKLEWVKSDINATEIDYPCLNEKNYINYIDSNKTTTLYSKWKLKYSNDEHPYIINTALENSIAFNNSFSNTFYPQNITPLNSYTYQKTKDIITVNNLLLPFNFENNDIINKVKYYSTTDLTDDKYKTYLANYKNIYSTFYTNWFNILPNSINDIFSNNSLWETVSKDNYVYFNGILYNLNNILDIISPDKNITHIDKFGVFIKPTFNVVSSNKTINSLITVTESIQGIRANDNIVSILNNNLTDMKYFSFYNDTIKNNYKSYNRIIYKKVKNTPLSVNIQSDVLYNKSNNTFSEVTIKEKLNNQNKYFIKKSDLLQNKYFVNINTFNDVYSSIYYVDINEFNNYVININDSSESNAQYDYLNKYKLDLLVENNNIINTFEKTHPVNVNIYDNSIIQKDSFCLLNIPSIECIVDFDNLTGNDENSIKLLNKICWILNNQTSTINIENTLHTFVFKTKDNLDTVYPIFEQYKVNEYTSNISYRISKNLTNDCLIGTLHDLINIADYTKSIFTYDINNIKNFIKNQLIGKNYNIYNYLNYITANNFITHKLSYFNYFTFDTDYLNKSILRTNFKGKSLKLPIYFKTFTNYLLYTVYKNKYGSIGDIGLYTPLIKSNEFNVETDDIQLTSYFENYLVNSPKNNLFGLFKEFCITEYSNYIKDVDIVTKSDITCKKTGYIHFILNDNIDGLEISNEKYISRYLTFYNSSDSSGYLKEYLLYTFFETIVTSSENFEIYIGTDKEALNIKYFVDYNNYVLNYLSSNSTNSEDENILQILEYTLLCFNIYTNMYINQFKILDEQVFSKKLTKYNFYKHLYNKDTVISSNIFKVKPYNLFDSDVFGTQRTDRGFVYMDILNFDKPLFKLVSEGDENTNDYIKNNFKLRFATQSEINDTDKNIEDFYSVKRYYSELLNVKYEDDVWTGKKTKIKTRIENVKNLKAYLSYIFDNINSNLPIYIVERKINLDLEELYKDVSYKPYYITLNDYLKQFTNKFIGSDKISTTDMLEYIHEYFIHTENSIYWNDIETGKTFEIFIEREVIPLDKFFVQNLTNIIDEYQTALINTTSDSHILEKYNALYFDVYYYIPETIDNFNINKVNTIKFNINNKNSTVVLDEYFIPFFYKYNQQNKNKERLYNEYNLSRLNANELLYDTFDYLNEDTEDRVKHFTNKFNIRNTTKSNKDIYNELFNSYYTYDRDEFNLFVELPDDLLMTSNSFYNKNLEEYVQIDSRFYDKLYIINNESNITVYNIPEQYSRSNNYDDSGIFATTNLYTCNINNKIYGFYIFNVEFDNTFSSFNLYSLNDLNINVNSFLEINDISVDDIIVDKTIKNYFYEILPLLKINLLSILDTINKNNIIIKPENISYALQYRPTNIYDKLYKNTLDKIKEINIVKQTSSKRIQLSRYINNMVPLITKLNQNNIEYQSGIKFKNTQVQLLNTGKYPSIKDTIYTQPYTLNTNYFDGYYVNIYTPNKFVNNVFNEEILTDNFNIPVKYIPFEYKHFNYNKFINLPQEILLVVKKNITYDELLNYEVEETILKFFEGYINKYISFLVFDSSFILFLYKKYNVIYDSYPVSVNGNVKQYNLTLKLQLK